MRKGLWTVFSILLIAMVLTACAAPAPTATPPPAPTKAPAAAQPTAAPVQPTAAATAKPTAAPVQPTTAPAAKPWKVCMVYSGAIGDAGWNFVIDQARKKAEQKFGMQIPYVEGAAAPSDAERVMSQFAEQGCNEIFTTTNVYGDIPAKVAAKYPNVIIESEEGIVGGPPNMRIYRVPFWEPNYLLGVLAAKLSKTGVAGWIAGYQAVPAPSALSAFVLGARSVNPNFILKAVFLNTYSDPPKEKAAVESLIAEGADVIGHGLASPTIVQTAEERQVYSFGRMAQCTWGPKYCMASSSINWEALLQNMIQQAMDGSWKNNMVYWAGVKDGSMDVIEINASLPADVKQLIATTKQKIGSGEIQIFRGPIMDNTGAEMVPAGKTLTPEEAAVQTKWAAGLQKK